MKAEQNAETIFLRVSNLNKNSKNTHGSIKLESKDYDSSNPQSWKDPFALQR